MPITPLHIGVLAPINHVAPGKVSAASFIVAQLLLDAGTIRYYLTGYGSIDHTGHTFYAALLLGAIIGLPGFFSSRWVWGAFIGTFSHVLLDALVHTDVELLFPWVRGNALYMGWMEPLSLVLLGLSAWWLLQKTSTVLRGAAGLGTRLTAEPTSKVSAPTVLRRVANVFASTLVRQWHWHLGRATCLLVILMLPLLPISW